MQEALLPVGKLPEVLLAELLGAGAPLPAEVLVGPAVGEDACVLAVDEGVLVAATDPITMTAAGVGGHAVLINANDVAVMGVRPRWFLCTVLLPEGTRESELRGLFADLRVALERLGVALVGGHTEVTPAVRQTLVVGQMLGTAPRGAWVRSAGMRPGDVLLQIGPVPVEGAAVLAAEAGERLASVDEKLLEGARRALEEPGISVVEPALHAFELGATAMHDPTEGGLSAGLWELARASGLALEVDDQAVLWFPPGAALCRAVGADPWGTLASGALLAAFPPERADLALASLAAGGRGVARIATAAAGDTVHLALHDEPLARYERDELSRVL